MANNTGRSTLKTIEVDDFMIKRLNLVFWVGTHSWALKHFTRGPPAYLKTTTTAMICPLQLVLKVFEGAYDGHTVFDFHTWHWIQHGSRPAPRSWA